MANYAKSLPVLMYHYISDYQDKLSISPALFEEHCRVMADNGWFGVGLHEAEEFFLAGSRLPPKSFLITLDDGYLDNYVYAWPILKKYGHKGVIFPVADKITDATQKTHPATPLRPTVQHAPVDVQSEKKTPEDLPDVHNPVQDFGDGYPVRRDLFFNWHEARAMEKSGVVFFGGHSLRHDAVFISPEYTDVLKPGARVSPFNRLVKNMLWGMPWFKREAELASRAFIPNPDLLEAMAALVPQTEKEACVFFQHTDSVNRLKQKISSFGLHLGRFETDTEQKKRLHALFYENQAVLSKELGHSVRSFCWPWGLSNQLSIEAAKNNGFSVFFNVAPGPNPPGKAVHINRFNAKRNAGKTLNRLRIYSHPLLGALYTKIRF